MVVAGGVAGNLAARSNPLYWNGAREPPYWDSRSPFQQGASYGQNAFFLRRASLPSLEKVVEVIRRSAGAVPFSDDVLAMWYCALDRGTPSKVRASIIGALAYLVVPTDAIPDFLVGLGFSDNVTVLTAVVALVASHIKPEHREQASASLARTTSTEPAG